MTNLRELLDTAAGDPCTPTPDEVSSDVRRGRQALQRRRGLGTIAGGLALAAAIAIGVVVVPHLGGGDPQVQAVVPGAQDPANPGVDLVAYDGSLNGSAFRPAEIPSGWSVGGNDSGLLVAPPGQQPEMTTAFRGKIFVYLQPKGWGLGEEAGKPVPGGKGEAIAVGDRTGYLIEADPSAMQLEVPLANGTSLRVQVPLSLKWDDPTMARFLAGVTVLDSATSTAG